MLTVGGECEICGKKTQIWVFKFSKISIRVFHKFIL